MISPSQIALHAAGFDPVSNAVLEKDAQCIMCGINMKAGEAAAAWDPSDSFTNWFHLQAPGSVHVCPYCAGAWRAEFVQGWITGAIFNADGVHRPNSVETLAHAILYPPKVPFVWIRGDQNQQHLVWRTPVTTDANLLRVRLGEKVAAIRRLQVLEALEAVKGVEVALKALPKEKQPKKKANPGNESGIFKYLDWQIFNPDHGLLSNEMLALCAENEVYSPQFVGLKKRLEALNFGEVWALMILLKSKVPVAPPVVATPKII